ncbi:3-deoxy-D-manno-octulosonic acid transferase [Gammaproteobacteria bacterium]|nr:3-deoxy-D-manno-octulosonic acid transferase [Gammaproteobacteria bacterium]
MKLAIYNLLILLLIPIFQLRILLKSFSDKGYRAYLSQRYGRNFTSVNRHKKKIIWFHAVSLGEVIGSQNVIKLLLKTHDVVLTTTTPTGFRKAQAIYKDTLAINYAPWDLNIFINRFLDFHQPAALLIFETEIWPAMISQAKKLHIPIFLVNGRLSAQSFNAYSKVSWLVSGILKMIDFVFVQTSQHQERFMQLGVAKEKIAIAGSVKFDAPGLNPKNLDLPKFFLGASTHEGEEKILLQAFKKIGVKYSHKLFICPRHPERAKEVQTLANQMNFKTQLYSRLSQEDYEVCVIDSIGLLPDFYKGADLALVGGSLVPRGGHNLIEPAVLGTPIIVGKHTFNFEEITANFINKDACLLVHDENELYEAMQSLLEDENLRSRLSKNAEEVVSLNQGSTETQVSYILNKLGE